MSRHILAALGAVLLTLPSVSAGAEDAPYWIKVGLNPDGTLRCKPNSNCNPLYFECCGTPGIT